MKLNRLFFVIGLILSINIYTKAQTYSRLFTGVNSMVVGQLLLTEVLQFRPTNIFITELSSGKVPLEILESDTTYLFFICVDPRVKGRFRVDIKRNAQIEWITEKVEFADSLFIVFRFTPKVYGLYKFEIIPLEGYNPGYVEDTYFAFSKFVNSPNEFVLVDDSINMSLARKTYRDFLYHTLTVEAMYIHPEISYFAEIEPNETKTFYYNAPSGIFKKINFYAGSSTEKTQMKIYSFKSNKWILLDSIEASGSKLKIILMNTMKYRKYKIEITPIEATHKHNYLYLGIAWMEV